MLMLILDVETAAAVAGATAGGAVLEPRPLADGFFALPERVLDDPHHAQHYELLESCARRPVDECFWPEAASMLP